MTTATTVDWGQAVRLAGLRRFATAITVLNLLGHFYLGFEQSWAQPLVALATAYLLEIILEAIDAQVTGRSPKFVGGGPRGLLDYLLSAHITALAVSMLLYANDQLVPVAFATAVAVGSKRIFQVRVGGRSRHVLNPSNFGITVTLLLLPWIGIAPPYMFTENLSGVGNWVLPGIIIMSGSFINARFTKRIPLLLTWLGVFALQAALRSTLFGNALGPSLLPMTGLAFLLYTFYMVTDPATTPSSTRGQILFGAGVGATYGVLMASHIVFGLFFSLTIVCSIRALSLVAMEWSVRQRRAPAPSGDATAPTDARRRAA